MMTLTSSGAHRVVACVALAGFALAAYACGSTVATRSSTEGGSLLDGGGATDDGDDAGDGAGDFGGDGAPACTQTLCGSLCVDTATNPHHCGGCGQDCQGATCVSGSCDAIVIATVQGYPFTIAVDKSSVYWTTNTGDAGAVMKCPISGCNGSPSVLAQGKDWLGAIAADGTNVYFATTDTISKCAVAGCNNSPTPIASGIPQPGPIAVDATSVYFSDGTNQIRKCSINGCNNAPVAMASDRADGIAVDATTVYWSNFQGEIQKCAAAGCNQSPTALAWGPGWIFGVAVDATNVYWTNRATAQVFACAIGGCGNKPTMLASAQPEPGPIAASGSRVFWSTYYPAAVLECAATGCNDNPDTVASIANVGGWNVAIAVDATNVYWTEPDAHVVMKRAKW